MTPQENLLRIFQHKEPNWIPCTFHTLGYNIPAELPKEILKDLDDFPREVEKTIEVMAESHYQYYKKVSSLATEMLKEVVPGDNFTFIIPCGRAPLRNLQAVLEVTKKYGRYPLRF